MHQNKNQSPCSIYEMPTQNWARPNWLQPEVHFEYGSLTPTVPSVASVDDGWPKTFIQVTRSLRRKFERAASCVKINTNSATQPLDSKPGNLWNESRPLPELRKERCPMQSDSVTFWTQKLRSGPQNENSLRKTMTSKQSPAYSVGEQATSLECNPCFIHHHLIPGLRPSSLLGTKDPSLLSLIT